MFSLKKADNIHRSTFEVLDLTGSYKSRTWANHSKTISFKTNSVFFFKFFSTEKENYTISSNFFLDIY